MTSAEKFVNAVMKNKNLSANKKLEDILKKKCVDRVKKVLDK